MKKSAFTMVELVFVIAILGILAAVAIPKLVATRQDAKATTAFASFQAAIIQVQSDTTTKGSINNDFRKIVDNSPELSVGTQAVTAHVSVGGTDTACATATVSGNNLNVAILNSGNGGCTLFSDMPSTFTIPLLGTNVER